MPDSLRISIDGTTWSLLAERAAFWRERRWLIVADAHFGKAATFRAHGVPVPHGTTAENLLRLDKLIDRLQPQAIVFLGDLFHARQAHTPATLSALLAWRERHAAVDLILVEGNHDRAAGAPPMALHIQREADPWRVGDFAFCHHPRFVQSAQAFAGHLHPVIRLHGRADDGVRLPCFWLRKGDNEGLIVLPAFGSFTGGAIIDREDGDRVIAVAEDRVVELPAYYEAAARAAFAETRGQKL